jgi:hypothetical protein
VGKSAPKPVSSEGRPNDRELVGKFAMRVVTAAPSAEASDRFAERADCLAELLLALWEEECRPAPGNETCSKGPSA